MVAHGLTTKFLPLYFMIIAFLFISDYTRDTIAGIDPTTLFFSSILFFGGLVLIYEGFNNMPKKGSTIGTAGFIFFFIFAFGNIIFSLVTFFELYDPLTDDGDINLILQMIIVVDIGLFLAQGLYEIVISKRFVIEKVFN